MTAFTLDGKKLASELEESLKPRIAALLKKKVKPCLAVIMAGENDASAVYVARKEDACKRLGIISKVVKFPAGVPQEKIIKEIKKLNRDKKVHGILVQLPLPAGIDKAKAIEAIAPEKDADGFTPYNLGLLALGAERLAPCTPKGVLKFIELAGKKFEGARVCIVGHGLAAGMPLAIMLANRNCTVSVCDKFTQNLGHETSQADILISCAGVPGLIKSEMVKDGAVVIDVGTTLVEGKLKGDVDFAAVKEKASFITPVPGGVGPMTVACLMENTVIAAEGIALGRSGKK
ncbi:MAG: bifunctional 5,10-methylenetetrahydrofolate dehydrogenase/5,10-methenyltetrahydrofolate cyclohydrolase [Candidatus Diapherotrites archaeon]|nr:bifunctional 5,10-methylenetetrahydrofolate dehydrogenase/5,10-methenyltetrahydrofolate cyclohydrolase [Candidatus Diapherotrites archaeon]